MESPNQRISQARANRIPLFLFLGFCTIVIGLSAYASYQRSARNIQKHSNERSFTPDVEYGYSMSKKLSELQDATPVAITLNPSSNNNADFWQQYLSYLQQYETPQNSEPSTPIEPALSVEPPPHAPHIEDGYIESVDASLTAEEQLKIQLQQQRATALLQALRSSTTVSNSNSASLALAQKINHSNDIKPNTSYNNTSPNAALSQQQQKALQQGQQQLQYPKSPHASTISNYVAQQGLSNNGGTNSSLSSDNPNAMQGLNAYQVLANNDTLLNTSMETVLSPFLLRQGALLPCVLLTGINSDLPGLVQAQITQDVFDSPLGQHLLIPRGTKVIGQYASAPLLGQKRLMLAFNRVIFPDGKAMNLGAMPGTSQDGYSGFDAQVDTHFWQLMGNAILLGGISAGIAISVDDGSRDENGNLTLNGALTQGLGQSIGRVLTNIIERNMTTSPTLSVQPGFVFNITLTKDIYFPSDYHAYNY